MPQVKELKELGVAGSATNEQADTEAEWRILNISSYLPLFISGQRLVTGYEQKNVTGYGKRHVARYQDPVTDSCL